MAGCKSASLRHTLRQACNGCSQLQALTVVRPMLVAVDTEGGASVPAKSRVRTPF